MRIKGVKLENYGSFFGCHAWRVEGRGLTFIGGVNHDEPRMNSNGSGKSTGTAEAIEWCLFGVPPKGDHADSVVNDEALKRTRVTVEIEDDAGAVICVARTRKWHGERPLRLWVGGEELTTHDTVETQRLVDKHIGLDRSAFRAAVVFGQTDRFMFADASDVERVDILSQVFGLEQLDVWLEASKTFRERCKVKIAEADGRRQGLDQQLWQLSAGQESAKKAADAWRYSQEQRLAVLVGQQAELDGQLQTAIQKREAEEALREQFENLATASPAVDPQIAAYTAEDQRLTAEIAELDAVTRQLVAPGDTEECLAVRAQIEQLEGAADVAGREAIPVPTDTDQGRALSARVLELDQQRRDAIAAVAGFEADKRRAHEQLTRYHELGTGACPTCGQEITDEHLTAEISRLNGVVHDHDQAILQASGGQAQVEQEMDACRAELGQLDAAYQQALHDRQRRVSDIHAEIARQRSIHDALFAQQQAVIEDHNRRMMQLKTDQYNAGKAAREAEQAQQHREMVWRQKLAQLEREIAECAAVGSTIQDLTKRLTVLQHDIQALGEEKDPNAGQLHDLAEQAKEVSAQRDLVNAELQLLGDSLQAAEWWVEAFGPRGVRSYIFDTRLHELTQAVNEGVQLLTGGTHWVQLDTTTAGRTTKTARNKINLRVFRYTPADGVIERGYRSMSGGEKQRVSLGVDFGLAQLIARRASKRYETLFLDELFQHLDRVGKATVVEMLDGLKAVKDSVYVIEHDDEFAQHFDHRIIVEKRNRRSLFTEGMSDGEGYQVPTEPEAPKRRRRKRDSADPAVSGSSAH